MKELDTACENDEGVYDISRTSIGTAIERGRKMSMDEKDYYRRDVSVEKSCSFSPFHTDEHSRLDGKRDEEERRSSQTEWYQREFSKINKKYLSGRRGSAGGRQ